MLLFSIIVATITVSQVAHTGVLSRKIFIIVAINWPDVTYTQVDSDVNLSDFTLSASGDGYIQLRHNGKNNLLHRNVMGLQPGDKR